MTLLIIYATISIFFSFLCSILEAVLLSITPTFINIKKSEGHEYATELEILKKDVDKPLIAILTINTIAHTSMDFFTNFTQLLGEFPFNFRMYIFKRIFNYKDSIFDI